MSPARGPLAGWRVLVVDDHAPAASLMAELLAGEGAEVDTRHTGRDALARADTWQPHLVLLDLGLPDISGLDVARQLHRPGGPLLVALSGHRLRPTGAPGDPAALFAARLTKPVDIDALLATLQTLR